jgi:uncharacterized membrane protein YhaH (DUF805 family)
MVFDMIGSDGNSGTGWLLFGPSGRVGRQLYLMSVLLWLMLQGAAVSLMLAFENTSRAGLLVTALVLVAISVATFVSFIMLSVKRLHDMGFGGFFVLLLFIPVASFFVLIALLFWPSAPPNAFGERANHPK